MLYQFTALIDLGNNNARSVLFSLPCPYQLSIWSVISSNFFYYVLGAEACRAGGKRGTVPPQSDFGGGTIPPQNFQRQRNFYLKHLYMVWNTTKLLKSGLKTRLERFKNQKFSYPGEGDAPSLDPIFRSLGPSGLGAYNRPFGLRFVLLSPAQNKFLCTPLQEKEKR